jgi:outer membrane protein OmpA-like peptidoglycan-associated protein
MNKLYRFRFLITLLLTAQYSLWAGNGDRAGEAGAYELLINTQPRTMGLLGINSANVRGIDALGTNIAGLAHNKGLSVFSNFTSWLSATDTRLVNIGVGSELSPGNNLGFSIGYMSFGDIPLTTTADPTPISTFSPYYLNIGFSYAKVFGRGVRAGFTGKFINESLSNLSASGFALDAGMQYTTGEKEDFHFGVYIRNLGLPLKFSGDGLTVNRQVANGGIKYDIPFYQRAAKFELPTQFVIAVSKDMYFGAKPSSGPYCKPVNRLSLSANFTYNSFIPNTYGVGAEYSFKETFSIRLGGLYEKNAIDKETTTRAHMGVAAGFSYDLKMGKKDTKNPSVLEISYNYRPSWVFNGTHNLGFTFYTSKYSYCDEYVVEKKVEEVAKVAKESKPKEEKKEEKKPEPEIRYITKYDTIFKEAPAKIETVVEYSKVNDMLNKFAGNIEFKTATAILTDRGEGALMVIGELMRQYPQSRFSIAGHTDNDGLPENNMRLSKLRAKTVARYLYEFKAIPENSMIVEWYGEEKPVADNSTEAGRQRNRRVEIKVSDAKLETMSASTPIPVKKTVVKEPAKVESKKVEVPKVETKKVEAPKVETIIEKAVEESFAEPVKTPQQELGEISTNLTFKTGTDSLTRFAKKAVSNIAKVLKANSALKLKIEAHTDNTKYGISNLDLSNNRAKAIIDMLKAEGIDATRISSEGFGDSKPIDTNDSEIGKTKNRRIELKVVN